MKTKFFPQNILRMSMLIAVIFSAALINDASGQCNPVTRTVSGTGCTKTSATEKLNYNINLLAQRVCGTCTKPQYCHIQRIRNISPVTCTSVPDSSCAGGVRWNCTRKVKYECACAPGS
jgi:hypothetical protein